MSEDLPSGWSWAALRDVCVNLDGRRVPVEAKERAKRTGPYPYYGASGIIDWIDDFLFEGPHLLVAEDGANLLSRKTPIAFPADGKFWVNNHAHVLAESPKMPLAFLERYLNSIDLRFIVTGSAQPKLTQKALNAISVPVPPLEEQRRIVARIEELTAHSKTAKQALQAIPPLLEKFRQSVLAAAFRGDLTAEWRAQNPDIEPAKALLERTRIDRQKLWEQSGTRGTYQSGAPVNEQDLPSLPAGWCWVSWGEIGFSQNGRAYPSKHYQETGEKLLRPGNLHVSGRLDWTAQNTKRMPETWGEEYPEHVVHGNELVMNLTAQSLKDEFLGRVCLTEPGERCLLNQRIGRLTPVNVSRRFCFWLFKSPLFRRYVDTLNTGSLIQHMFTSQINEFVMPLPPKPEQEEMVRMLEQLLAFPLRIERMLQDAKNKFDSLDQCTLAKAFQGRLLNLSHTHG